MGKGPINKEVGKIDKKTAVDWNLNELENSPIVQELSSFKHFAKHAEEFLNVESYHYATTNIEEIIKLPEFIYYNQEKRSLEFYKTLLEDVCVIVKLPKENARNKQLYVATIYPVKENKKKNRFKKAELEKREIEEKLLIEHYTNNNYS